MSLKKCRILATFYIGKKRVGPPDEFVELEESQAIKAQKARCVQIIGDVEGVEPVNTQSNFENETANIQSPDSSSLEESQSEDQETSEEQESEDLEDQGSEESEESEESQSEDRETSEEQESEDYRPKRRGRPKKNS